MSLWGIKGPQEMNIRTLALGLLLAATPAFAADIDGKWVRLDRHAQWRDDGQLYRSRPTATN